MSSVLSATRLTVCLAGRTQPVLRDLDLDLLKNEVVGVVGRSGSGKSSLLHALAGLLPWARGGHVSGGLEVGGESLLDLDAAQRADLLATCLDRPESQLFLPTAGAELHAARQQYQPDHAMAAELVEALGVGALAGRQILELSSGERQRVALAAALLATPRHVLLDEPTTHLDTAGVAGLCRALEVVKRHGGSVLLTEHAPWRLGRVVDRWTELREGQLRDTPAPAAPKLPAPPPPSPGSPLLHLPAMRLLRGSRTLLATGSLRLQPGELVFLGGPNGAGKSSLARALTGHAPSAGLRFMPGPGAHWRPGDVSILLPHPELQLFAGTVMGELGMAGLDSLAAGELLARLRLASTAARAPWTLSRGERQRLVLGTLEAAAAPVLVLDEPAQGLDPGDLADLAAALRRRTAAGGAVLLLSHRQELSALAHRRLWLESGRLAEVTA